jgi:hypothetical protein
MVSPAKSTAVRRVQPFPTIPEFLDVVNFACRPIEETCFDAVLTQRVLAKEPSSKLLPPPITVSPFEAAPASAFRRQGVRLTSAAVSGERRATRECALRSDRGGHQFAISVRCSTIPLVETIDTKGILETVETVERLILLRTIDAALCE